ncbi:Panacea domain-containing protein [Rheinheimera pleomorphica]|uniref:Panacea domain-containing protein n=1 Tax=Rheinheimera pleomorphica TaxID=2703963 RepID=UPI001423C7E3|nr:type II toxin-antitoxin system antitoxin SocA domain-containing protein [Rheinheimera pleomorphica]
MTAPYSGIAVANSLIEKAKQAGIEDVSPMKVQKLVYYAHAWYLTFYRNPLVEDKIQAWEFGPVVYDVYAAFRQFGNAPITSKGQVLKFVDNKVVNDEPTVPNEDTQAHNILDQIITLYGRYNAVQLSNMTHNLDEPWYLIKQKYPSGIPYHVEIPNELIASCFTEKYKKRGAEH